MKKALVLFLMIYNLYSAKGQNLVPNNDFELYGTVPCGWTGGPTDFANAVIGWTSPTGASPDVHSTLISNTCSNFHPNTTYNCSNGSQVPHSGNIFTGFYTHVAGGDYREYIQVQLTSPMIVGIPYIVQLYVSLGEESQFATNNIGVGFSTTLTNNPTNNALGYLPDILFTGVVSDTGNWVLLSDTIVPAQPFEYLIIGNFLVTTSTTLVNVYPGACWDRSYYYCDDVVVRPFGVIFDNTCYGDSTFFTLYSNPNVIANSWNFDDPASGANNLSFIANPYHIFSAPGTYSVMNVNFFINGSSDTSYTTVNIGTTPSITLGNDTTLCLGDSILLNAGGGNTAYLWSNGTTLSSTYITSASMVYVEVNNNGCIGTDSININFTPCSLPSVSLSSSDTTWCDKKAIDYFDLSTNNPTSWQWFFQGAQPDTSTMQNPTGIYYPTYGSFDVTLIACNASGCDTLYLPAFINEYQLPGIPLINLVNDTLYSTPAFSYQWYFATNAIVGATNQYYVPTQYGSYFVVIADSNGCEVSSTVTILSTVQELSVPLKTGLLKKISCFDATGRLMLARKITTNESIALMMEDIKKLASGVYFIHGEGNNYSKIIKIFNPK